MPFYGGLNFEDSIRTTLELIIEDGDDATIDALVQQILNRLK